VIAPCSGGQLTVSEPHAGRLPEVDALKVPAILAVVLIHATRSEWDPTIPVAELWLKHTLLFAVPAFFAASGYLYSSAHPLGTAVVRRRLVRILVPYLVASLVAQTYWRALGKTGSPETVWKDLLLCSSLGPYYFVFVLVVFVLLTPLLSRAPRKLFPVLVPLLLLVQFFLVAHQIPALLHRLGLVGAPLRFDLFWYVRNPFLNLGYFVLGWWVRRQRGTIARWVTPRRRSVSTAAALAFTGAAVVTYLQETTALGLSRPVFSVFLYLGILAALAFLYAVAVGGGPLPAALRRLSDDTYAIYLYHLFALMLLQRHGLGLEANLFQPDKILLLWAAGVLGGLLVAAVGRAVLGRSAHLLLGA
jgi:surface polysaccharide O-acyltransferase-like enzyme